MAIKCPRCQYRALEQACYCCDYHAITGSTRKAQPRDGCHFFQEAPPCDSRERKAPVDRRVERGSKLDAEQALALYHKGWMDVAIAKELKVSPATVGSWRKRMALGRMRRKESRP